MIGSTLHPRPAELSVMSRSAMNAARIRKIPKPRAKMTRDRLPLQIVQRMKLGWACLRSENSTLVAMELKALG